MRAARWLRTFAPLALLGLVGCGQGNTLAPVSGKITNAGAPVADASVSFVPDPTNKESTPGIAVTGADGSYQIRWQGSRGVAPGRYHVTVRPALSRPPDGKADPYMARIGHGPLTSGTVSKTAGPSGDFDATVADGGGTFDYDLQALAGKPSGG